MSEQELLELAAQAEQFSTHPIARSILTAWCGTPDRDRVARWRSWQAVVCGSRWMARPCWQAMSV